MASDAAAKAILRLSKERAMIEKKAPAGMKFEFGSEADPLTWRVRVKSPATYFVQGGERPCPYGGREFVIKFSFPETYPFKNPGIVVEPAGALLHPNFSAKTGEVCAEYISANFAPTKNSLDLVDMVVAFLQTPNLAQPFDADIASLMSSEKLGEYEAKAKAAAATAPAWV